MTRVLLTAYEPYEQWPTNASWMLVQELTRDLPSEPQVTTRLYPVDFTDVRQKLEADLKDNYDVVLMLGQAPGYAAIQLEAIGVNVGLLHGAAPEEASLLAADGPVAYRSSLPLESWAAQLRASGIPAQVSFHAGTYLCNAALYLAHYFIERLSLPTQAAFLHIPLDPSQVLADCNPAASCPIAISAVAIRQLLEALRASPTS